MAARINTPHIGDVIDVAKGACHEYRAAFRLRVDRLSTTGVGYTYVAGTVINANGQPRTGRGAERTFGLARPDRITVVVPAPITGAELDDAYAENVVRSRCGHLENTPGCVHPMCHGVPPVDGATFHEGRPSEVPHVSECGSTTFAREIRDAVRAYPTTVTVCMPTIMSDGPMSRWDRRRFTVYRFASNGHTVDVISYHVESWHRYAVVVDGVIVNPDVMDGRNGTRHEQCVWLRNVIVDAVRAPEVTDTPAPVRTAVTDVDGRPIRIGDAVSVVGGPNPGGTGIVASQSLTTNTIMVMWAGETIIETSVNPGIVRVLPNIIPSGGPLVTRARDLWEAVRPARTMDRPLYPTTPVGPVDVGDDADPAETAVPATESEAPVSDTPATAPVADQGSEPTPASAAEFISALIASAGTGEPVPVTGEPADDAPEVKPVDRFVATVDRDALADALEWAVWAVPSKPAVPVLAGVMLTATPDGLLFETFDYDVSARTTVPADIDGAGRVLVTARGFRDMVKTFPKVKRPTRKGKTSTPDVEVPRVRIDASPAGVIVEYGTVRVSLPTMPAEDHPSLPGTGTPVAIVDAGQMAATVARVAASAGRDDTLPNLTAINMISDHAGSITMTTTDRYRAATDTLACTPGIGTFLPAMVPATILAYVCKRFGKTGGTITIGIEPSFDPDSAGLVSLACGTSTITTRCVDGQYPPIGRLIDAAASVKAGVTIDRDTLVDAVKRVGMAADRSTPVRLSWSETGITVEASGAEDMRASETIPCDPGPIAPGFIVAYNHAYFIDSLVSVPAGPVNIGFRDSRQPCLITSDALPTYRHIVMPVRIDGVKNHMNADGTPVEEKPTVTDRVPGKSAAKPAADQGPATDAGSDAPTDGGKADPVADAAQLRRIRAAVKRGGYVGFKVSATEGTISIKNGRVQLAELNEITGRRFTESAPKSSPMGGVYTYYRPIVDTTPAAAPAPVADAEPAADAPAPAEPTSAAPVDAPSPAEPVAPAATPAAAPAPDADAVPVARVAAIIATGKWSMETVRVGRGRDRHSFVADVYRLDAGYLRRPEYLAVNAVMSTLGGGYNRTVRGFVFSRPELVWGQTGKNMYTPSGEEKVSRWLAANTPAGDAEPAATVDPAPVADAPAESGDATPAGDAEPAAERAACVRAALGLDLGDRVAISGVNGNGEPVSVRGYVVSYPVDADRRGVRVHVSQEPGGRGRPVYVRDDSAVITLAPEPAAPAATVDPAPVVDAEPAVTPAPVAVGLVDTAERAAHVAYERMMAGDFGGARAALAELARVAPVGYLVAGRFTLVQVGELVDAAERKALAAATTAAPVVDVPAEPVRGGTLAGAVDGRAVVVAEYRHVDVAEPAAPAATVVDVPAPVVDAEPAGLSPADAAALAEGATAALAAMPATCPVTATPAAVPSVVTVSGAPWVKVSDGPLSFVLAAYGPEVNGGRSYRAARKAICAALAAAKIRTNVRKSESDRRGFVIECSDDVRARVVEIVRATVTVDDSAAVTV